MESVPIPGYVCVTSKKHVVEPFDLEVEDQKLFSREAEVTRRKEQALLLRRPWKGGGIGHRNYQRSET